MQRDRVIARAGRLPAADIADEVNAALAAHGAVVVTAPPGAGKSTLLPLTILSDIPEGKILMLEPRRLAARQIAERMAELLGEPLAGTVGYRVRFEKHVSASTRIEVLTEGILTRMLVSDPTLEGVAAIVFDEFHERSLQSDFAFALTRRARELLRPDLRLVIMSATIDATAICRTLGAPLVEAKGRMFPVEVRYASIDTERSETADAVARTVRRVLSEETGDVLAFLPGQAEIMRCAEQLAGVAAAVLPLYGHLSPAEQRRAVAPSAAGERKVVLATSIAETSLTIEGVRVVVDSGLCRTVVFDQRSGLSRLETVPISLDMAAQRAGRAGRLASGICYRLWTKAAEQRMAEQRKAEIEDADLASVLLDAAAFGEPDAAGLPWLTPPPVRSLAGARQLLLSLGAIDERGGITPLGARMTALPCHPRISRMILRAAELDRTDRTAFALPLACDVAALLEEKDPLAAERENDTDMALRINLLRRARQHNSLGRWQRIARIAAEYCRMMHARPSDCVIASEDVGRLVAYAYPERVAMALERAGCYRLASGEEVRLDHGDALSSFPWLAVATLDAGRGSGRIFLAAAVAETDLMALCTERDHVAWDGKQGCLLAQREKRIGRLLLDSRPLHDVPRSVQQDVLCDAVEKEGLGMLSWDDAVGALQRRVAQVASWHPELNIPDISTSHMLRTAHEWLPFFLDDNGRLRTTRAALQRIDLAAALWTVIPYDVQQQIERLAPSHVVVPTGSRIRLDYRQGAEAPVLSVRLQECFGMEETPRVDDGRVPVLVELLSPGFKPVQLTRDLRSFWHDAYFEIRKELRRRYPKHCWPDNPLEAKAVRGVAKK